MPIRPENRDRYPADWRDISHRIRFDRAGGRCECDGRCGRGIKHRQEAVTTAWTHDTAPGGPEGATGRLGLSWVGAEATVEVERG